MFPRDGSFRTRDPKNRTINDKTLILMIPPMPPRCFRNSQFGTCRVQEGFGVYKVLVVYVGGWLGGWVGL